MIAFEILKNQPFVFHAFDRRSRRASKVLSKNLCCRLQTNPCARDGQYHHATTIEFEKENVRLCRQTSANVGWMQPERNLSNKPVHRHTRLPWGSVQTRQKNCCKQQRHALLRRWRSARDVSWECCWDEPQVHFLANVHGQRWEEHLPSQQHLWQSEAWSIDIRTNNNQNKSKNKNKIGLDCFFFSYDDKMSRKWLFALKIKIWKKNILIKKKKKKKQKQNKQTNNANQSGNNPSALDWIKTFREKRETPGSIRDIPNFSACDWPT